jgi:hypothetical protein
MSRTSLTGASLYPSSFMVPPPAPRFMIARPREISSSVAMMLKFTAGLRVYGCVQLGPSLARFVWSAASVR